MIEKRAETELLAPAGDISSAYAAINSGADAIYTGLKSFSARASADNFNVNDLWALCEYAHALDVRVHVALNTLVKQSEVENFISCAVAAHNAGADALIIQDIYLGKYLKRTYPQMCLHLSTQAGVNNVYGARQAKEYGFDRVILARETPFEEIEKIAKIIQTEVFVQGALCTCFSGQCYLSSFAGGNSGNRGRCKQPCRKMYSVDREGFGQQSYAISLSDLSVGEDILKLSDAGVYSFKIEGRMRRPEYVAAAVSYYRSILGGEDNKDALSELKRTYNRGNYTRGLAFGQDKSFISSAVQGHIGEFCGVIEVKNGNYVCHSTMQCAQGDAFKILRNGKEVCGATFAGNTKDGFCLNSRVRLKSGDKAFITTDARLNAELLSRKKLRPVTLSVYISEGDNMRAEIDGMVFESQFVPSAALSRAVSRDDIIRCFDKVDTYPFEIDYCVINISGNPFVPASALNQFRRETYAAYFARISSSGNRPIEGGEKVSLPANVGVNSRTAVIARDLRGVKADIGILKPDDYSYIDINKINEFDGQKYLFLPPFINGQALENIKPALNFFDGVYCDGYWAEQFCRELNIKLFAGTGFNIANSLSLSQVKADFIALSKEITLAEARPLSGENTFYLTAGDIKVMDMIYCPFGKTCKTCDRRDCYSLTDEDGRTFPLRRYKAGECRFELFNCANLISPQNFTGALADCTLCAPPKVLSALNDGEKLKKIFKSYTSGHAKNPVL